LILRLNDALRLALGRGASGQTLARFEFTCRGDPRHSRLLLLLDPLPVRGATLLAPTCFRFGSRLLLFALLPQRRRLVCRRRIRSNSGNVPIPAEDFERPVVLELGANAVPLPGTIEVKEAKPAELHPNVSAEGATLIVQPLLLNPGDSFSIAALVRDFSGPLAVDGRVVGVSKIGLGEPNDYKSGRLLRTTLGALEGGAAVLVVGVAGATLAAALWGLRSDHKEHTRIVLESGTTFCGKVLRVDASRLVVQLKDGGRVRILRTANVRSIRNNAC
jgi:hypothetical protein